MSVREFEIKQNQQKKTKFLFNMAPFKLKFRMGSGSRSISQEIEEPVQYSSSVQQPLLMRQSAVSGSNTTLSSEYNSMSTNNDQHNLLPNTFEEETGNRNQYNFPPSSFLLLIRSAIELI